MIREGPRDRITFFRLGIPEAWVADPIEPAIRPEYVRPDTFKKIRKIVHKGITVDGVVSDSELLFTIHMKVDRPLVDAKIENSRKVSIIASSRKGDELCFLHSGDLLFSDVRRSRAGTAEVLEFPIWI